MHNVPPPTDKILGGAYAHTMYYILASVINTFKYLIQMKISFKF